MSGPVEKDKSVPVLVSNSWLEANLSNRNVVLLDAGFHLPSQNRNAKQEFVAEHIPGARFFDIDAVADHATGLPHMLPAPEVFAAARRAGPSVRWFSRRCRAHA